MHFQAQKELSEQRLRKIAHNGQGRDIYFAFKYIEVQLSFINVRRGADFSEDGSHKQTDPNKVKQNSLLHYTLLKFCQPLAQMGFTLQTSSKHFFCQLQITFFYCVLTKLQTSSFRVRLSSVVYCTMLVNSCQRGHFY